LLTGSKRSVQDVKPHIAKFEAAPFIAAPLLRAAHAQTIAGRLLRRVPDTVLRRERVELPDGDFVDLDFAPDPDPGAPLVLLLHGLEGSARRGYALNTYRELAARGLAGVGMNFRSCSGEPNRTARFYHSGDTEDIRFVLKHLSERAPRRALGAIGFSLGGNALVKYLGEEGERARARVQAAVAVSVPFDLGAGARLLDGTRMGRFYTRMFLKTLRGKAEAKRALIAQRCDLDRIVKARSFWEFDDAATAPLHGFAGADDYYARSSSARFVGNVRVPLLVLQSEDDPFLPANAIPRAAMQANRYVTSVITKRGGHVGFIGGSPHHPKFWAEEQAARFLALHLRNASSPRKEI
jgi:predicted alpha/beta-fold hydrolase